MKKVIKVTMMTMISLSSKSLSLQNDINLTKNDITLKWHVLVPQNIKDMFQYYHKIYWHVPCLLHFFILQNTPKICQDYIKKYWYVSFLLHFFAATHSCIHEDFYCSCRWNNIPVTWGAHCVIWGLRCVMWGLRCVVWGVCSVV